MKKIPLIVIYEYAMIKKKIRSDFMVCRNCNRLLAEDFKFCPECATPTGINVEMPRVEIPQELIAEDNQNVDVSDELNSDVIVPQRKQKTNSKLRKAFLITMIASLSISALMGILVILIGTLGETEAKILGTTLALGGFSLIGLCCSTLYDKINYKMFSTAGMLVCILGFVHSTLMIWQVYGTNNWELPLKVLGTFIIVSLSMAQASILLLIKYKNKKTRNVLWTTVGLICVVALMLLAMVYELIDGGSELFFRTLSVFAILDALGTITTPILNKIGDRQ